MGLVTCVCVFGFKEEKKLLLHNRRFCLCVALSHIRKNSRNLFCSFLVAEAVARRPATQLVLFFGETGEHEYFLLK